MAQAGRPRSHGRSHNGPARTSLLSLLQIPLTPGAVELADISAFHGIAFDVRGEGNYRLKALAYAVRNGGDFEAAFQAGPEWKTQKIEFSSLTRQGPAVPWTGKDVRMLQFELSGAPGSHQWLELDNLHFFTSRRRERPRMPCRYGATSGTPHHD